MTDCIHSDTQHIGTQTVKETYATSWFEFDDDGYPNEVFGDRSTYWDKEYRVCLACGTILSHDMWAWDIDRYAPEWVKRNAAQVMRERGGNHE